MIGNQAVKAGAPGGGIQIDLPASAFQVCSDEGVWHRGSGRWDLYAAFGQPDPRTQELTGKSAAHCVIE